MKKFFMIEDPFKCSNCGYEVNELKYTVRNHCPNCLYSKHVDINPGDRKEQCQGLMEPIGIEKNKKDTYKIIYRCQLCGVVKKNIMAKDDNWDKIIELSIIN